jgi:hypothetical protein
VAAQAEKGTEAGLVPLLESKPVETLWAEFCNIAEGMASRPLIGNARLASGREVTFRLSDMSDGLDRMRDYPHERLRDRLGRLARLAPVEQKPPVVAPIDFAASFPAGSGTGRYFERGEPGPTRVTGHTGESEIVPGEDLYQARGRGSLFTKQVPGNLKPPPTAMAEGDRLVEEAVPIPEKGQKLTVCDRAIAQFLKWSKENQPFTLTAIAKEIGVNSKQLYGKSCQQFRALWNAEQEMRAARKERYRDADRYSDDD